MNPAPAPEDEACSEWGARAAATAALGDQSLRVDRWLWTARLFHTRALALEAVRGGHVRINGLPAKASRPVRPGDEVRVWRAGVTRVLVVRATAQRRVPARLVPQLYCETGESLAARAASRRSAPLSSGGRPTKRVRRQLGRLLRSD